MFVVLLRFSANRASAGRHVAGHQAWIQRGVDEGVFALVGSLEPDAGGAILAHGTTREDLHARIEADPFVAEDVVCPEIVEISPNRVDERLSFLVAPRA